jgi:PAS domain S-box-containing protein
MLDWRKTPLGAPETWPQSLRTVVRIMLDSRYAMWMLWGPDLTFFCNDAYLPTVGIRRNWVLGARSDKVWEEIWPDIGPRISQVLTTGIATWDEALLLFLERSGFSEETYHTFSYSPVYGDDGRISGMLCVVTEVTDRVISERRLAFLGALGSALAGSSSEEDLFGALTRIIESNSQDLPFTATYLFDVDRRAAHRVAQSGLTAPHPAIPPRLSTQSGNWPIEDLQRSGAGLMVDDLTAFGAPFPGGPWQISPRRARLLPLWQQGQSDMAGFVIIGLNPFRPFDHDYDHFLDLVIAQLTSGLAAVHAREAERRRADALASIDRAKSDFFANVSHEFRTPLTLILGSLDEVLQKPADAVGAETHASLQMMQRNSERLLKLVNSLLDFSRLEAQGAEASLELVELGSFTTDIASVFRSAIENAGLSFQVDSPPLDQPVLVDPLMWEKIVMNLLSNAFKYTLTGSIRLQLRRADAAAVLTVTDTGTGVSADALPHLFTRFYRVPGAQGRTHEGTGIGLALVKELVKLHSGTIDVQSKLNHGTQMTVAIPLQFSTSTTPSRASVLPKPRSANTFLQEAMRWNSVPSSAPSVEVPTQRPAPVTAEHSRGSVLLAEDNADMREYLQRLLEERFNVVAVHDGQEALEYLQHAKVDLVLSDIMMPRLDGYALLRAVRDDPTLRDVPVVLLSARAGEDAQVEGLDVGADDYLVKPFSSRELLARVSTHLKLAKTRRNAHLADRRFRAALESAHVGFALLKSLRTSAGDIVDFEYLDLNSHGARALGRVASELIGKTVESVFPGTWNTPRLLECFKAVVRSGEPQELELPADSLGSDAWFHVAAAQFDDGLAVWFADITERMKIASALDASRQELHRVTDVASVMLAHCDQNDRFLFANRAYASRFGLMPVDLVGQHIADIAGKEAFTSVEPFIRRALRGEHVEFEMMIPYARGGERFMNCVYVPDIDSTTGEVTGFVAAITDISERRRLEDQLRDADRRKDEFLATLAHELRNPLAPILHAAAVATTPAANSEQIRRSHSVIDRQVRHMAVLLDDLLDISRITQGKLQLRLRPVDVHEVVEAAVEAARPTLEGKSHRLTVSMPPQRLIVNADSVRLAQILSNLLNNAGKYTDPAGTIRLNVTLEGPTLLIRVTDNGVGIAGEALPTVFTMFSQVKSALDRAEGGLGIGLALVKGLVELHGGRVSAHSEGIGHGSEFTVQLPVDRTLQEHAANSVGAVASRHGKARRILVADDNKDAADTLQMLLSIDGHEVRVATDGAEALKLAEDFHPELLLLDIGMPKLNGYEVAKQLRTRYPQRRMKLVALSGWGQAGDKQRAEGSGFDRHLTKPIDPDILQDIIRNLPNSNAP